MLFQMRDYKQAIQWFLKFIFSASVRLEFYYIPDELSDIHR